MSKMNQDDHKERKKSKTKKLFLPCHHLIHLIPAQFTEQAEESPQVTKHRQEGGVVRCSLCAPRPRGGRGLLCQGGCYLKVALKALPMTSLRTSLVPAPISYSLASRRNRPIGYSLM